MTFAALCDAIYQRGSHGTGSHGTKVYNVEDDAAGNIYQTLPVAPLPPPPASQLPPALMGLHSSTFRLNVCTSYSICGIRWVELVTKPAHVDEFEPLPPAPSPAPPRP